MGDLVSELAKRLGVTRLPPGIDRTSARTTRELVTLLGMSEGRVRRALRQMKGEGRIILTKKTMTALDDSARRVPAYIMKGEETDG